ncbi:MAG: hypothetical protein HQL99_16595 [Magnetococcales bacterium]|nr:hypothetical protein [Magnetococcales bacterium]
MIHGHVDIERVNSLEDLSELLMGLDHNQALIYGLPVEAPAEIVTEAEWVALGRPAGVVPRTARTFHYRNGPGIMCLDYDPQGKPLTRTELVAALRQACPGLEIVPMLWWTSAGSRIYQGDKLRIGTRGQRLYFLVSDASDIPRAGKALIDYLWAAGCGGIKISTAGTMLERTLLDPSMWQGSHLDFAAGAVCQPPLEQRRGRPLLIPAVKPTGSEMVDTRVAIPDPDAETIRLANANRAKAKDAKRAEAQAIRQKWMDRQALKLAQRLSPDKPEDPVVMKSAMETVQRAVEKSELGPDWPVYVVKDGKRVKVTVAEILQDRARWNGCLTLDPIEPGYDGGRVVGKLFLTGARPVLHSFAHGGCTYRLVDRRARVGHIKGREFEAVDEAMEVLRRSDDIFDLGDLLVVADDRGELLTLTPDSFRHHAAKQIQFYRTELRKDAVVETEIDPPASVIRSLLDLRKTRRLKPLRAVITMPTLRPDGSVLDEPGYDVETGLLYVPVETVPFIPTQPSRQQIIAALRCIWRPFRKFPFADPVAKGVHLAAILTVVVSEVLPTRPAFAYDAPAQGSGKTLLAKCLAAIAGSDPVVFPPTADEDEIRKRLLPALTGGAKVLIWDNVVVSFDSAALACMLTGEFYCDRVLGRSELTKIPNTAMLVISGNNLDITGDMVRRMLSCRIDPGLEDPRERVFTFDPLEMCQRARIEIVVAALTVLRGWLTSGEPRHGGRTASFERWDDWVRQCVIWVGRSFAKDGFADPMLSIERTQAMDPERESLGVFLRAWWTYFSNEGTTVNEVLEVVERGEKSGTVANPHNPLELTETPERMLGGALRAFIGGRGELNRGALGKILSARKDRIVDGLRLIHAGKNRKGVVIWSVEQISDS